jgi:hypothetical protein
MDEDQLYLRPGNPARYEERHPTGSELGLIMWQIAKLRRDLVRAAVWAGLAATVIVGIEMWSRYVAACSSN